VLTPDEQAKEESEKKKKEEEEKEMALRRDAEAERKRVLAECLEKGLDRKEAERHANRAKKQMLGDLGQTSSARRSSITGDLMAGTPVSIGSSGADAVYFEPKSKSDSPKEGIEMPTKDDELHTLRKRIVALEAELADLQKQTDGARDESNEIAKLKDRICELEEQTKDSDTPAELKRVVPNGTPAVPAPPPPFATHRPLVLARPPADREQIEGNANVDPFGGYHYDAQDAAERVGSEVATPDKTVVDEEDLTQHSDEDEAYTSMSELTEKSDLNEEDFDPMVLFYV